MVALKRIVLAALLLVPATALADGVRETHPNFVGGEILGRGFAITLNYERYFTNQLGLGGGVMAIGISGDIVTVLPLYVSYTPGNIHSLYLAAGPTMVGGGSIHDFENAWVIEGSVGYQYTSPSGFFVRPLFTLMASTSSGSTETLLWPGITIGGSF